MHYLRPRLWTAWGWAALVPALWLVGQNRVAVGQALPRAGAEVPILWGPAIKDTGDWTVNGDGTLSLGPSDRKYNHALADANGNAFVRARLTHAAEADVAIVFRAKIVSVAPLRMQAYGFTLDARSGTVAYLRWDEGGVRDPGVRVTTAVIKGRQDLEVLLWHVGANFVGVVSDALSQEQLASLAWSDTSYTSGKIGLFVNRRSGTALAAEVSVGSDPTAWAAAPRSWLTSDWLVTLPVTEAKKIPARLRSALRLARPQSPEEAAFITTEVGVVALRRSGLSVTRAQPGVPFIYRDQQSTARATAGKNGPPALGLKDDEAVAEELTELARQFPDRARLFTVGKSVEGRTIFGLRVAGRLDDTDRPAILLFGAHHGLEALTPEMVLDAARVLLNDSRDLRIPHWLATLTIILVPIVNVDGVHAFWHLSDQIGRKNRRELPDASDYERGVDLERNYPFKWGYANDVPTSFFYRGPSAGSEPEAQAMMALAAAERFVAAISYHASALKIVVPYSIGGVDNPEPSEAWSVANGMIEQLTHRFGKRRYTAVKNLYPVDGTAQDWYYNAFGTVAFILEAPANAPAKLSQLKEAVEGSRPAWQYLLDRWLAGPSVSVHVLDKTTGKPLEAFVTFAEIKLRAGERWTTRPDTGWFHHYLPTGGTFHVQVEAQGRSATQLVTVGGGVATVELSL